MGLNTRDAEKPWRAVPPPNDGSTSARKRRLLSSRCRESNGFRPPPPAVSRGRRLLHQGQSPALQSNTPNENCHLFSVSSLGDRFGSLAARHPRPGRIVGHRISPTTVHAGETAADPLAETRYPPGIVSHRTQGCHGGAAPCQPQPVRFARVGEKNPRHVAGRLVVQQTRF